MLIGFRLSNEAAARCALDAGPTRAVTQVIDGETLKLDDGSEARLLGIISPRAPDSASDISVWPPSQDARAALERLVLGRSVELTFAGPRTDRYGRALVHAFVDRDSKRTWVQGELLAQGHGRSYAVSGAVDCLDELISYERIAFHARQGLWSNAAYQVRNAEDPAELMRYRHTLQLVEGVVAEVAEAKGRTYLNFGTDWRSDFTAAVDRGRNTEWSRDFDFKALRGERVRVRGYIERKNGPYVELTHPTQLEVVPTAPEPAQPARRSRRRPAAETP